MANNELSSPTVTTFLSKWILSEPREYTTGLFLFPRPPALTYLSKNFKHMKRNTIGFQCDVCGDERYIIHIFLHGWGIRWLIKPRLNVLRFEAEFYEIFIFRPRR